MSDIAQVIMSELGSSSPYPMTDAAEDSSDNELASTMPASLIRNSTETTLCEYDLHQSNHF